MALLSVADARARILKGVKTLSIEKIPLAETYGRVLAKDLKAGRDQPPFDASAMDGYAVRHADLAALPAQLKIIGTSAAGHGFRKTVATGQAVRILTGAPVPRGADTVVIQENTSVLNGQLTVHESTSKAKNIRVQALDFKRGDVLIAAGVKLNARDIGLAAAGNHANLPVYRQPIVALFTTGDELVLPGQRPHRDQIVSSNSSALAAMATALGAKVINYGIVEDSLKATKAAIKRAKSADILMTTGGASVGDHDYVQQALSESGIKIDFWKIAMRPGKPFMFGRRQAQYVLGLPGNPVSAIVCAALFLEPLLAALQGTEPETSETLAKLNGQLPGNDMRQDYLRGFVSQSADGQRSVETFSMQDSSMQRTLRKANCLIIRPPNAPAANPGDLVPVLILKF